MGEHILTLEQKLRDALQAIRDERAQSEAQIKQLSSEVQSERERKEHFECSVDELAEECLKQVQLNEELQEELENLKQYKSLQDNIVVQIPQKIA